MSDIPTLVNWAGALTDAGQELAAWAEATRQPIPNVPAQPRDSTPPVARFFLACPDEAAALWQRYSATKEQVTLWA